MSALGRRTPTDWRHVESYPLRTLLDDPAHELVVPPPGTEKGLGLPWWWPSHDQGQEGACVGFGASMMMSVTNHYQRLKSTGSSVTYRYDSRWLYQEAQLVDEWTDTPPAEGTSLRAGCRILQARGHRRVQNGVSGAENPAHGIAAYRWATTHDEVRAAIYAGLAITIGVNWYSDFDDPVLVNNERWIGQGALGFIRGGHAVCLYRMSDRREAFGLLNSWGSAYPPVWIPYATLDRLLLEDGEAAVITDR